MNKLTALYAMFKKVQEKEAVNALITAEGKLDEIVLGTLSGEVHKGAERCEKKVEVKFGDEILKFERSGSKDHFNGCCSHGSNHGHKHHGYIHGHHGNGHKGCCSFNKIDKAMFMLKMLDKTEYVENHDGTSNLTLQVAFEDLPEKIQEAIKHRSCKVHEHSPSDCHEKFAGAHKWLESCGCMDLDCTSVQPQSIKLSINLKSDKSPEKVNLSVWVNAKDQSGTGRVLTLNVEGQCQ